MKMNKGSCFIHGCFMGLAQNGFMRHWRRWMFAGLILVGGCTPTAYYQKRELGRRIMQFDANDLEVSYQNKVNASREVSGGRPGHSAGGGCGCGN